MGNHDIGNGEGDYDTLQNRWYDYTEAYFGRKLTHPYYYEVIDGYYFIVLGMEDQLVYEMMMTEEQFTWLESVLVEASASENRSSSSPITPQMKSSTRPGNTPTG